MSSWATRPLLQRVQKGREVVFSGHDAMEPYHDKWFISEDQPHACACEFNLLKVRADRKICLIQSRTAVCDCTGGVKGSGTLVNSSSKLFHDVTGFLPGRRLKSLNQSYAHDQFAYSDDAGFRRDQDSGACGSLFDWTRCNGRY